MSSPCHIEIILSQKEETVEKPEETETSTQKRPKKLSRKKLARERLRSTSS